MVKYFLDPAQDQRKHGNNESLSKFTLKYILKSYIPIPILICTYTLREVVEMGMGAVNMYCIVTDDCPLKFLSA
jgi:hypothetical protein